MNFNYVNKLPSATSELSVKKKEEMSLRKKVGFATVSTDSSCEYTILQNIKPTEVNL